MRQFFLPPLLSCLLVPSIGLTDPGLLREYVNRPDENFSFAKEKTVETGAAQAHVLRLTSQEWRNTEWTHRLTVIVPENIHTTDTAMLFVTGGSNRNEDPFNLSDRQNTLAMNLADRAGIAVAVLEQVPNQPLLRNLYEDDLIAYTFSKKLETGESDWPLLFPMVKSATRGMDAVTGFLKGETGAGPENFILAGASKRGWTTWLTAAVDSRVKAIAPVVFDILNFAPQLELQQASYDGFSERIRAYEEQNLFALLSTEAGAALGKSVDPFTYREKLDMPKLILLGTNDPFWSVDAAGLYFGGLPDSKHLYYAPNSGHRFDAGMAPTLLAFVKRTLDGEKMPRLDWTRPSPNKLIADWDDERGRASLWSAHSSSRDFREAKWSRESLEGTGLAKATLDPPEKGFSAHFIEVRFPGGDSFALSTEIVVTTAQDLH